MVVHCSFIDKKIAVRYLRISINTSSLFQIEVRNNSSHRKREKIRQKSYPGIGGLITKDIISGICNNCHTRPTASVSGSFGNPRQCSLITLMITVSGMVGNVNFTHLSRYSYFSERDYRRQFDQLFGVMGLNWCLIEAVLAAVRLQVAAASFIVLFAASLS